MPDVSSRGDLLWCDVEKVIADELVAAFGRLATAEPGDRWACFSIAVLDRVLATHVLAGEATEVVERGIEAWRAEPPAFHEVDAAFEWVFDFLESKNGLKAVIADEEDSALHAAMWGLESGADPSTVDDAAAWVEDLLMGRMIRLRMCACGEERPWGSDAEHTTPLCRLVPDVPIGSQSGDAEPRRKLE